MNARPEQIFFNDPALDRAMGVIMDLAAELYVTRDRLRVLERTLEARGVLEPGQLDAWQPTEEERVAIAADRDAFVAHLMEHLTGLQVSKGITG